MNRFFGELKKRGVLKIATAYLVASWLILEIGHTLFLIFDLPHVGLQIVFVLLVLGFPVTTAAAWRYRFAASGQAEVQVRADGHGPQLAIVFGMVALLVIGTAVVMRFMGYQGHGGGHSPVAENTVPSTAASPQPQPQAEAAFAPPKHSIAVMPFVNMSGNAQDEYFSDGLSEELLNSLARINALQVAARTSSFSFKGANTDIPTIGRRLNVAAVLEGSVRRVGERVRITAQLINAADGYHLWSETYDRELKDILALQTDIATAVTGALRLKLLPGDEAKLALGGSTNPDAYDAYLLGVALFNKRTDEATDRGALSAFERAVALDPEFALAQAGYASALTYVANVWDITDAARAERMMAMARGAVDRAERIAPTLAAVYLARCDVETASAVNVDRPAVYARKALELEPGNAAILTTWADMASRSGHLDEALDAATRAVRLDPLSPRIWRMHGIVLTFLHRHDEAARSYEKALLLQPDYRKAKEMLGYNDVLRGRHEQALQFVADSNSWDANQVRAIAYRSLGRAAEAAKAMQALQNELGSTAAFQYAEIHAQWGEPQRALEWLRTAVRLRDPGLKDIKVSPLLDPVRSLPEFQRIVQQLSQE